MATANTFDLLILPVLECTAGLLVAFAIIGTIQALAARLSGPKRGARPLRTARRTARSATYRPASLRLIRSGGGVA